ncbi:MAG: hypothetical protein HIU84_05280 [Acidobacteria bacterium]|nr:hypothetical protein [Acidobacteriota bacterium]
MRLVRNLTSWLLVGVFTVFLAVGVEMVSHKTFSHGAPSTSSLSATTPSVSASTSAGTSSSVATASLQSTPPITITRTYHGDDSSTSTSRSGESSLATQSTYQDN